MRIAAIMAGGPSLTQDIVDAVMREQVCTIVTNDTWRIAPEADVLFACDAAWWLARNPRVSPTAQEFAGKRIVSEPQRVPDATYVKPYGCGGGSNSALQAAYFARDFDQVLLFGVDLCDDCLTHWHGLHQHGLGNPDADTFRRARKAWSAFAELSARPNVINCNPRSALECFPKVHVKEVFS